jgi:histone H2B
VCVEFSSAGPHPLLAKRRPPPLPRPKSTEAAKATKKTAKTAAPADGEKKKRGKLLILYLQECAPYPIHLNFSSVLKQVHPDTGISNNAMAIPAS